MDGKDKFLIFFSIVFIILCLAYVLIPYIRRKSPLFTTNNMFIGGSALFVGLSGINSVLAEHYFDYSLGTFIRFYSATTIFYITYAVTYHRFKLPIKIANSKANRWPSASNSGLTIVLIICLVFFAFQNLSLYIPGLSRLLLHIGLIAPGFAVVFSFYLWDRAKSNPLTWILLFATIALSFITLFSMGGGRRALYAAVFAVPLCCYWRYLHKWKPTSVIVLFTFLMIPAVIFDIAYASVRWKGTSRSIVEVEGASDRLSMLRESLSNLQEVGIERIAHIAQSGVEYSLVSIHVHTEPNSNFPIQPFHSVYTLVTVPIPRDFWPEKPLHLGMNLAFDAGTIKRGVKTNIGPGIAGHIYHEGGLFMAIFYGFFMAGTLRFIDQLLVLRWNDPLLLGFVASSAFHIIGWSRGAIFTFTLSPLTCFVVMAFFMLITKLLGLTLKQSHRPMPPQPLSRMSNGYKS